MNLSVKAEAEPGREAPRRREDAPGLVKTVVAGFLVLAASNAVGFYGLAVYLGGLEASGAFSLKLLSNVTSVFFIVSGVMGLLVGRGLVVLSVRTVLLLGAAVTGGGVWLVGHASAPWQLICAYVLLGAGMSLTGPIPLTTALIGVARASGRRDQAMAVMLGGMTAGGAVFVPIMANVVERHGLPVVTSLAAPLVMLGIAVPALLVAHAGGARSGKGEPAEPPVLVEPTQQSNTLVPADALMPGGQEVRPSGRSSRTTSRTFLLLGATFACFLGTQVGFNTQLYAIASELDIAGAGGALGVVAATGMVARVVGIVLVKWAPPERFLGGMAVAQGMSSLVLLLFSDQIGLYVAAGLLGMAVGNASVLAPVLTLKFFGREAYSRLVSRLSFVNALGIAAGPMVVGNVRAATGSYHAVLIGVTVLSLLAGCSCMFLERVGEFVAAS